MLGYYVHNLSPFLIQFNSWLGIRWYGLAYVTAFLLGILLLRYLARKGFCDIPEDKVGDFVIGGALFGVLLGGRLGYMVLYDLSDFVANPLIFFHVMDGGMSAHGGMIGLTLYTWWYAWKHKVSWRNIGDNMATVAPVGLFLGRLANFINGELYGRVTNVPWAMQFPAELYRDPPETVQLAIQDATAINPNWNSVEAIIENSRHSAQLREMLGGVLSPRHPSQLYEAGLEGLMLFTILWLLRTRVRLPNGVLAGLFFLLYALARCMSEFVREPDAPLTGPFTRGQFLSFFLVLIGLGFLISAWKQPTYPKGR